MPLNQDTEEKSLRALLVTMSWLCLVLAIYRREEHTHATMVSAQAAPDRALRACEPEEIFDPLDHFYQILFGCSCYLVLITNCQVLSFVRTLTLHVLGTWFPI